MQTRNRGEPDIGKVRSLPEIPVALELLRGVRWELVCFIAVATILGLGLGWMSAH